MQRRGTGKRGQRVLPDAPHALWIPKWWPGQRDPQLGDFIRKQATALAERTKVTVLHLEALEGPEQGPDGAVEIDGLYVVRSTYRASSHPWRPWRKAINFIRYGRAARSGVARCFRERGRPDVTHVHILVRPALVALWLRWRYHIPYVLSEQSSEYLDGNYARKGRLFHALNRALFRWSSGVSVVSHWLGQGLKRARLCSDYRVVPNVIPGLGRPLPASGDPRQFLVVADLVDKTKNVSGVLHALALVNSRGRNAALSIIGDGPDRGSLEDLTRTLHLEDRVEFLGRLPNTAVLDHMAHTGSAIINSNVETFSVVTGEALAQGKPVIATRCGGPEAFIQPANGLLIPPRDPEALATAMEWLMDHGADYDPATIRRSVAERSSVAAVAQGFMDLYRHSLRPT